MFRSLSSDHFQGASVVYVPTCLRSSLVYLPSICVPKFQKRANFSFLRANVLMYQTACQFSIWCANVPKGVQIFQTFILQNAKGNFYTLLLYKNSTLYLIS